MTYPSSIVDRPKFLDLDRILPTFPIPVAVAPVRHLVTLRNLRTEHEVEIEIHTKTDGFCDVIREIQSQRSLRGLVGYEIFETILLTPPF